MAQFRVFGAKNRPKDKTANYVGSALRTVSLVSGKPKYTRRVPNMIERPGVGSAARH
jgi:hypothetical protein